MKRLSGKLTYANVVATLALVIAVAGGTAFAASKVLPKNSVGTKQIKNKAVTSAKIANGAVTGAKVANGAVTGAKVVASTLGTVPSATHADSAGTAASATHADSATSAGTAGTADRANSATTAADAQALQGKGAAQIESAAKLSCPSGTNLVAGSCFETATRPPATYLDALYACAGVGRLLPDMTQLQTYVNTEVITTTEWSGQMYFNESIFEAIAIADGLFVQLPISDTKPYRCMVPPSN